MTKRLFATSLFIFLFVSNASAWDMGAYIENAQAGEGKIDSSAVQKIEQKQPEDADSSMALTEEKKTTDNQQPRLSWTLFFSGSRIRLHVAKLFCKQQERQI